MSNLKPHELAHQIWLDSQYTTQNELAKWQDQQFGGETTLEQLTLGVCEEAGELAHAVLKNAQGIRGLHDEDRFLAAAGDAVADCMIYLAQVATALEMDLTSLYEETAAEVMRRVWEPKR